MYNGRSVYNSFLLACCVQCTEKKTCELVGRAQGKADSVFQYQKQYTMVFPTANISGCTMRIIGWEFTYSGTCGASLIAWEKTGSSQYTNRYRSNSTSFPRLFFQKNLVQVFFTAASDKIIITADQMRYFGLEQTNTRCATFGERSTTEKTYYSSSVAAPAVGSSASLASSEDDKISFRVYLEGQCV